jgi:hypothetical protein
MLALASTGNGVSAPNKENNYAIAPEGADV